MQDICESIGTEGLACLAYDKMTKNTENVSKMVRSALFGTFCGQYQIVPRKGTYLLGLGHPCRGGEFHMNQFGESARVGKFK